MRKNNILSILPFVCRKVVLFISCILFAHFSWMPASFAAPKIDSISKNLFTRGENIEFTLNGSGFDADTSVFLYRDSGNMEKVIGSLSQEGRYFGGFAIYRNTAFVGSAKLRLKNGNIEYVEPAISIIDISNPKNPIEIKESQIDLAFLPAAMIVSEGYLYVGANKIEDEYFENGFSHQMTAGQLSVYRIGSDNNAMDLVYDMETPWAFDTLLKGNKEDVLFAFWINQTLVVNNYPWNYQRSIQSGLHLIDIKSIPQLIGEPYDIANGTIVQDYPNVTGNGSFVNSYSFADDDTLYLVLDADDYSQIERISYVNGELKREPLPDLMPNNMNSISHIGKLSGDYMYFAGGCIDEEDGNFPCFQSAIINGDDSLSSSQHIRLPIGPTDIMVNGNIVYLSNDLGLQLIDISEPDQPKSIGLVSFPDLASQIEVIGDTSFVILNSNIEQLIKSNYLLKLFENGGIGTYEMTDARGGLSTIDISGLLLETAQIKSIELPGFGNEIEINDDKVVVSWEDETNNNFGFSLIDVKDPMNPKIEVTWQLNSTGSPDKEMPSVSNIEIGAKDVFLYLGDGGWEGELLRFDIEKLKKGEYGEDHNNEMERVNDISVDNGNLYVLRNTDVTYGRVRIISIFNIGASALINQGDFDLEPLYENYGHDIMDYFETKNNIFYTYDPDLKIDDDRHSFFYATKIDVQKNQLDITEVDLGSWAHNATSLIDDVAITDSAAYIVALRNGVSVIDISQPEKPDNYIETNLPAHIIATNNSMAFVGGQESWLAVMDITEPLNPSNIGYLITDTPIEIFYGAKNNMVASPNAVYIISDEKLTAIHPVPTAIKIDPQQISLNDESSLSVNPDTIDIGSNGNFSVKTVNNSGSDTLHGAITFADSQIIKKAIIIAGGDLKDGVNKIRNETDKIAKRAHDALRFQGYTEADIYYLGPESEYLDTPRNEPTRQNLESIITGLGDTSELLLFFVGHGRTGQLNLNGEEAPLDIDTLNEYLAKLSGVDRIILIFDACQSGSFVSTETDQSNDDLSPHLLPPQGAELIVITSTGSEEPGHFLSTGAFSFSHRLWDEILNGATLGQAYDKARDQMGDFQTARINNPNLAKDLILRREYVRNTYKPYIFYTEILDRNGNSLLTTFDDVTGEPSNPLNGTTEITIRSKIMADREGQPMEEVWAVISQPNFEPESPEIPVTEIASVELDYNATTGFYEGKQQGFFAEGEYRITIFARNKGDLTVLTQHAEGLSGTEEERLRVYQNIPVVIDGITAPMALNGATSAAIQATISAVLEKDIIRSVTATITPPNETDVQYTIELTGPDGGGVFEGVYTNFSNLGVYLVRIDAITIDGFNIEPRYTVFVQESSQPGVGDAYETDNSFTLANVITPNHPIPQTHTFHTASDTDWVKFYALEGEAYTMEVTTPTPTCDAALILYSPDGSQSKVDDGDIGEPEKIADWVCPKEGFYHLRVVNMAPSIFGDDTGYGLQVYQPIGLLGFLTGILRDDEGTPISGAVIVLSAGAGVNATAITRPDGSYTIMQVPGDDYTMTIQKAGYEDKTIENVAVTADLNGLTSEDPDFPPDLPQGNLPIQLPIQLDPIHYIPDIPSTQGPATPRIFTVNEDTNGASLTPTLGASPYAHPVQDTPHTGTHWQISPNADFTLPVVDLRTFDPSFRTVYTVPESILEPGTTYFCRVRYIDVSGNASAWSAPVSFTTMAAQEPDTPDTPEEPEVPDEPDVPDTPDVPDVPDTPDEPDLPDEPDITDIAPDKPALLIPDTQVLVPGRAPVLRAADYTHGGNVAHAATHWQIADDDAFAGLVLDLFTTDTAYLVDLPVPELVLEMGVTYYCRIRFIDASGNGSEWSDAMLLSIPLEPAYDANADGVPDTAEVTDDMDMDEDGTPDRLQDDMRCVLTAAGNTRVCLKAGANVAGILALKMVDPSDISESRNRPESLPLGLVGFKLKVHDTSQPAGLVAYLVHPAPEETGWYGYHWIDGWRSFGENALFGADRMSVALTLMDGGDFDQDNLENGVIVDPSGLGTPPLQSETLNFSPPSGDAGGGGCFLTALRTYAHPWLVWVVVMAGVAAVMSRRRKR